VTGAQRRLTGAAQVALGDLPLAAAAQRLADAQLARDPRVGVPVRGIGRHRAKARERPVEVARRQQRAGDRALGQHAGPVGARGGRLGDLQRALDVAGEAQRVGQDHPSPLRQRRTRALVLAPVGLLELLEGAGVVARAAQLLGAQPVQAGDREPRARRTLDRRQLDRRRRQRRAGALELAQLGEEAVAEHAGDRQRAHPGQRERSLGARLDGEVALADAARGDLDAGPQLACVDRAPVRAQAQRRGEGGPQIARVQTRVRGGDLCSRQRHCGALPRRRSQSGLL
jgi:hypothetical protein